MKDTLTFSLRDYPRVYIPQLHIAIDIDTSNNTFRVLDSLVEFDTLNSLCKALAKDNGFNTISFINE